MRNKMGFAGKVVGAGALTALLATAAVAAPAPRNGGQWDSGRNGQQNQQQYGNRGQVRSRGQDNYGRGQGRQGNYGYGYGYQRQGFLRGIVERINFRYGTMTIRDEATGRFVNIDMQRMGGRGLRGLRRGEFVTVSGQWEGGNTFAAYQIS